MSTNLPVNDSRQPPLLLFFFIAFAFTWVLQLPAVFAQRALISGPVDSYMPFVLLGIFGPTVAAVCAVRLEGGTARELLSALGRWRVSPIWYVVALGLIPTLLTLGLWLYVLISGHGQPLTYFPNVQRMIAMVIISFAEEIGWRGYALPRLLQYFRSARNGKICACVVLGVLWTLWHIPMFLGAHLPMRLLPGMFAFFVPGTVLFTWVYLRSGRSLLLAVLMHMSAHLNNSHLALPSNTMPLSVHVLALSIAAVTVVAFDRKTWRDNRSG